MSRQNGVMPARAKVRVKVKSIPSAEKSVYEAALTACE